MTEVKQVEFKDNETIIKDGKLYKLVEQPRAKVITKGFYGEYEVDPRYASDLKEAIKTLHELKLCEGAENTTFYQNRQWVISYSRDIEGGKLFLDWFRMGMQLAFISPCFISKEAAKAAIDSVGSERILKMFEAFGRVYE